MVLSFITKTRHLKWPRCFSQQEESTRFPSRLQKLMIHFCPLLSSLPRVPWIAAQCSVLLLEVGLDIGSLSYGEDYHDRSFSLSVSGKGAQDSARFWRALDFDKLTALKRLDMSKCPPLPLNRLPMLVSSIKILNISDMNNAFWAAEHKCSFPVLERMKITRLGASGKELTQVLSCMPKLSELKIQRCENITGLSVVEQQQEAQRGRKQHKPREEEEIAAEGLLLLPPQLQKLRILECPKISLCPNEKGGGLQALCSLHSSEILNCPKFLACYLPSPSPSCFPFPTSLQSLRICGVETLAPLSNLSSLTNLCINTSCGDFEGVGLGRLLAQGCLEKLEVTGTPNLFSIDSEELSAPCSKLQSLRTDDVPGVRAAPICRLLSSSLTSLVLENDEEIERLTEEQDQALQLLTSLQELRLSEFNKLQCLPAELHRLANLKTLEIYNSPDIRLLPENSLPESLQKLAIYKCSAIRSLPKGWLPDSLRELHISFCPSIRTIPKGGLLSSLQVLDVIGGNSEES